MFPQFSCNDSAKTKIAALVMNANPFTLGHQYLVEKAASENDILHLFIVSEDQSLVPFSVRKKLVLEGTAHLKNIIYHESGPYIISNATFPSYFQKDADAVMESHANLDLTIFVRMRRLSVLITVMLERNRTVRSPVFIMKSWQKNCRKIRLHARLFLEKKQMVLSSALLLYEPPSKVVKWSC